MIRLIVLAMLASRLADAEPALELAAKTQFGVATAPFEAMTLPEAKGQAVVITGESSYEPVRDITLALRVPVVLASVAQPAGAYVDTATLANPQLGASWRWFEQGALAIETGVELGVPLARHSPTLLANRALAIANGTAGLASPELYTPGVVPITPSSTAVWVAGPWRITATLRAPVLLRFSSADLVAEIATPHTLGIATVIGAEVARRLTHRLELAAASQVVVDLAPTLAHVHDRSRAQDLERVGLGIRLGASSALAIELAGAIGGELGGSTLALGARFATWR